MDTFDITPSGGNGKPQTMSSLEIAELTKKRHDNVMADIKKMLIALHGERGLLNFQDTHTNRQNGQVYPIYRLPRRETLILVSGYKVELRARIIDRWEQLEAERASAPQFDIPKSYAEALRLAADQSEQINKLQIENAEMQPKAAFHDAVGKAINAQPIRDIAKVLGTGQNRMFKRLRGEKILMSDNKPYQRFVDEGYFRLVEKQFYDGNGESRTYTRTLVTGKGLAYLQKRLGEGGANA